MQSPSTVRVLFTSTVPSAWLGLTCKTCKGVLQKAGFPSLRWSRQLNLDPNEMAVSPEYALLATKLPDRLGIMQGISSSEDLRTCVLCQANPQSYPSRSVTVQDLVDNRPVLCGRTKQQRLSVFVFLLLKELSSQFPNCLTAELLWCADSFCWPCEVTSAALWVRKSLGLDWGQSCCSCLSSRLLWWHLDSSAATLELGQFSDGLPSDKPVI